MIPMGVAEKNIANDPARMFLLQHPAQVSNTGPGIDYDHLLVRRQNIQARRITAILYRFLAGYGNSSAYTPKTYAQRNHLTSLGISSSLAHHFSTRVLMKVYQIVTVINKRRNSLLPHLSRPPDRERARRRGDETVRFRKNHSAPSRPYARSGEI